MNFDLTKFFITLFFAFLGARLAVPVLPVPNRDRYVPPLQQLPVPQLQPVPLARVPGPRVAYLPFNRRPAAISFHQGTPHGGVQHRHPSLENVRMRHVRAGS